MTVDRHKLVDLIRYLTLTELHHLGYGHFGGSLSIVETLAALYGGEMRHDPKNPNWDGRDYLILSKGHAGPAWYAALAARGYFPKERLYTLNANGTQLPSHPDRLMVEGVEMTTGSMGQGISVAAGLAYGLRTRGTDNRVYAIVGDGELNEGQCWEAAQFIVHNRLTNLVVLVDENKRQLDGWTKDICNPGDFVLKFQSFGFCAERVAGNDVDAISAALAKARVRADKPSCIILDTDKGAGVDYVVKTQDNHHMRLDDDGRAAIAAEIAKLAAKLEVS